MLGHFLQAYVSCKGTKGDEAGIPPLCGITLKSHGSTGGTHRYPRREALLPLRKHLEPQNSPMRVLSSMPFPICYPCQLSCISLQPREGGGTLHMRDTRGLEDRQEAFTSAVRWPATRPHLCAVICSSCRQAFTKHQLCSQPACLVPRT